MNRFRTSSGGRIDRTASLGFTFDGQSYRGYQGDTLASALLANGVHLVGRSFKYHRPRGIVTAGSEEPNALVDIRRDAARVAPNLRATQVELYSGLNALSQNRWPSLNFDVGAANDILGKFFSAGFYYKTFMWPRSAWEKLYEPIIRRAAGLGHSPTLPDPDRYAQIFAHCEVLVVGSGPAGLAAALAASEDPSQRVILCDEQSEMGGSLLHESEAVVDGHTAPIQAMHMLHELRSRPNVTLLPRTTAFGFYPHNLLGLAERVTEHLANPPGHLPRERMWQVRAGRVVFATGSIERPLVFPGNDRPGVMMAEAARQYAVRYGSCPATAPSSSRPATAPIARRLTSRHAASPSPPSPICAPRPMGLMCRRRAKPASPSIPAPPFRRPRAVFASAPRPWFARVSRRAKRWNAIAF